MTDFNLTTSAVARATGTTESTVRNLADRGTIPCARDSTGRRLFSAESVEKVRVYRVGMRKP